LLASPRFDLIYFVKQSFVAGVSDLTVTSAGAYLATNIRQKQEGGSDERDG